MTAELKIRNLCADEIECRVGCIYEEGITLLLYKNARVDQAILDESFGIYGWQRSHALIGNALYCTISVWDAQKQEWIAKQDVGTTGDFEKEKSAASDSFKRACVNLGIGRELYTAPFIFIPAHKVQVTVKDGRKSVKDRFSVRNITVSAEKVITGLVIVNQRKEEVFRWGCVKEQPADATGAELQELYWELARTKVPEERLLKRYGVKSISEMDDVTRKKALSSLRKTKTAA